MNDIKQHLPVTTTDFSGLAKLKGQAAQVDNKESAATVAREFEALFIQMMLKSMRDAVEDGGLFSSDQMEFYQEMSDQQIAMNMSRNGGIGLAQMIEAQIQHRTERGNDG